MIYKVLYYGFIAAAILSIFACESCDTCAAQSNEMADYRFHWERFNQESPSHVYSYTLTVDSVEYVVVEQGRGGIAIIKHRDLHAIPVK